MVLSYRVSYPAARARAAAFVFAQSTKAMPPPKKNGNKKSAQRGKKRAVSSREGKSSEHII
jgi:hypothetical protein